ncbi:MAG: EF-hand domain-containing protein [Bacteroidota bacterium]
MRPAFHVLAVLGLLAACAPAHPPEAKAPPPTSTTSPNGEPLPFRAGADDCRGALAAWFNRADRNGDGVLDLSEMQADADRWFALADRDHDGSITADELAEMRRQLVPESAAEPTPEPGRGGPGHHTPLPRSQARVDAVMQADANADFRVSAAEFRAYVAAQFAERERGGVLAQAQVLDACSKATR